MHASYKIPKRYRRARRNRIADTYVAAMLIGSVGAGRPGLEPQFGEHAYSIKAGRVQLPNQL